MHISSTGGAADALRHYTLVLCTGDCTASVYAAAAPCFAVNIGRGVVHSVPSLRYSGRFVVLTRTTNTSTCKTITPLLFGLVKRLTFTSRGFEFELNIIKINK